MAASSKFMINEAERRFPVRIKLAVPPGLGNRLSEMHAWLDANCGADGWTNTPAPGPHHTAAVYFADATPCRRVRRPMVR